MDEITQRMNETGAEDKGQALAHLNFESLGRKAKTVKKTKR